MELTKMTATKRQDSTKPTRNKTRNDGKITSVLYGSKGENILLALDEKSWQKLFEGHSSRNLVLDLIIDNDENKPELIKIGEVQRNPITEKITHIDLIRLERSTKAEFEIPVNLVGRSEGQKAGGVLSFMLNMLKVECFPGDVPEEISIDINDFRLGEKFHVADLKWDNPKVAILDHGTQIIFTIELPKIKAEAVEEEKVEGEEAEGEEEGEEKEEEKGKEKEKPSKKSEK